MQGTLTNVRCKACFVGSDGRDMISMAEESCNRKDDCCDPGQNGKNDTAY